MITKPEHVLQADEGVVGFSWDGTSPHPFREGETVPNKETTMDWAEHQRIVCNARNLMASWNKDQHTGKGKDAFKALKDAYDGSNKNRSVLSVSKGIHQPETNPHLQVRVVATFNQAGQGTPMIYNYTFHLNVSATEIVGVDGLDNTFQWAGVQFSFEDANRWYRWPALAVASGKNSTTTRRTSISYASLTEHLNELAEQEKKRLRLEKIEQAKLQAASLEDSIKLELDRLKQEDSVELRRKGNEPSPKFFKGTGKAFVVNKYGKGYYVIWDAKTKKLIKTI